MSDESPTDEVDETPSNYGQIFDRLPATPDDRNVPGRASRQEIVDWWEERFGVDPDTFDGRSFWEKGSGKIWVCTDAAGDGPIDVEGLGMTIMRTRQEHWKPTTNAVQRFGRTATRNVIPLDPEQAATFAAGEDQDLDWEGDWGYLIATHEVAGEREPIGVGLYLYGELRSTVPKGRQESLSPR